MTARAASVLALLWALVAGNGLAQEAQSNGTGAQPRLWGGLGAGAVRLSGDVPPVDRERSGWRLELFGGVKATPVLWLGLKLGGVGLEPGDLNDPSEGEAISDAFALAEYHPGGRRGLFLGLGAGWASYTNNDAAWFDREGDGWGVDASTGYLWPLARRWGVAPVLSYSVGHITARDAALPDLEYDTWLLSLRVLTY